MIISIKVEVKQTNRVIIQNIKNRIVSLNLSKAMQIHYQCMTYLYLPCSNLTPMASCMNIWMNGIVSK